MFVILELGRMRQGDFLEFEIILYIKWAAGYPGLHSENLSEKKAAVKRINTDRNPTLFAEDMN